jgi:diguanylate cyclase (GGDEF)-like protein
MELRHLARVRVLLPIVVVETVALLLADRRRRELRRRLERRDREFNAAARLALVDSLTGLRNRRAFDEELAQALVARSRGAIEPRVALAMIDLRGLKQINDTIGHQEGDARLVTLAETLRAGVRGGDSVYRLGGDEFMLIMPGQGAREARRLIARLTPALTAHDLSVCAGVAEASATLDPAVLVGRADRALVAAKRGPDPVVVWQAGLDARRGLNPRHGNEGTPPGEQPERADRKPREPGTSA